MKPFKIVGTDFVVFQIFYRNAPSPSRVVIRERDISSFDQDNQGQLSIRFRSYGSYGDPQYTSYLLDCSLDDVIDFLATMGAI